MENKNEKEIVENFFNQIQDEILSKSIDTLVDNIPWEKAVDELDRASPLAKHMTPEELKSLTKSELTDYLDFRKEQDRAAQGVDLIFEHLSEFPNEKLCKEELGRVSNHFLEKKIDAVKNVGSLVEALTKRYDLSKENVNDIIEDIKSQEFTERKVDLISEAKSLASELNISPMTMETLYQIATIYFNNMQIEESLCVLEFLLVLDNYFSEFWLAKGICHHRMNDLGHATYAYLMASLMKPEDPTPYLRSAECFIALGDTGNAEACLEMAKYFKNESNKAYIDQAVTQLSSQF